MDVAGILKIVRVWTEVYTAHLSPDSPLAKTDTLEHELSDSARTLSGQSKQHFRWIQIFENKGAAMGCSNPHPHGQIWATTSLPEEAALELDNLKKYRRERSGGHMLVDYARLEQEKKERVIYSNDSFILLCPWWAVWPFETLILPTKHIRSLTDMGETEALHLAEAIAETTRRYDNLFQTSFPYSMGIHQAPLSGTAEEIDCSSLHVHFYPPLLRSATVRKFLVGYEMLAEPQRDITPEQAATRLRACGGALYRKK